MTKWNRWFILWFALLAFACGGGDSPTGSSPLPSTSHEGSVTTNDAQPAEPTVEDAPGCEYTRQGDLIIFDCTPVQHEVNKLVHFFINGPHPQEKIVALQVTIQPRQKLEWNWRVALTQYLREKEICLFDEELQIDVTHVSSGFDAPSNDLGWIALFFYERFAFNECDTPCEDEPVLVNTERTLAREGVCTPVQGEWGPIGCQKTDSYLVVETWKQCDMVWTTERYERQTEPCKCEEPQCEFKSVDETFCMPVLGSSTSELAWINANIPGSWTFINKIEDVGPVWIADKDYDLILLKSGKCSEVSVSTTTSNKEYRVITNVKAGQSFVMESGKDISHISLVAGVCLED